MYKRLPWSHNLWRFHVCVVCVTFCFCYDNKTAQEINNDHGHVTIQTVFCTYVEIWRHNGKANNLPKKFGSHVISNFCHVSKVVFFLLDVSFFFFFFFFFSSSSSSSSVALQPGVGLGILYNTPTRLSVPWSVSPSFIPIFLRSVDTSSSHLIFGLPLRLVVYSFPYIFFWNCGVLHSFYLTKPSYSLAFNEPSNVLPLNWV